MQNPPDLPRSTDIAIVGGGIMGASIAWRLAHLGAGAVTLFERSTIAAGASGRTGALLRQHYTNPAEATLAYQSLNVFKNWSDIVGGSCGFERTGLVVTIPTGDDAEANLARLEVNIAMQRSTGIETRIIAASELQDLDPFAQVDDIAAAAFEAESGCVDAVAATQGMARAARRAGASIIEGVGVTWITIDAGRIAGISTTHGEIRCGAIVVSNGPWSPALLATLGIDLPIVAVRVQVATFLRPIAFPESHPAYVDIAAGMFCRPLGTGRTMVGVSGGDQHDPVDPDGFDRTLDRAYPGSARAALARRYPIMRKGSFLTGHAGLYDMTLDAHPIIGSLANVGVDGLYIAAGFSGAGFKKGPAVGQAMAELIVHGASSVADLTPFRFERFGDDSWRDPWSTTEYTLSADFGHSF